MNSCPPETSSPEAVNSGQKVSYVDFMHSIGIGNFKDMETSGEARFLRTVLPHFQSPVVFDVGANEGEYTEEVLRVSAEAQVVAFEPHPKTFARLKERQNNDRVACLNCALGEQAGMSEIFDYSQGDGTQHASLYREIITDIHKGQPASYKIEVKTVDDIVSQCQIPRIDLLKIDVEGHELAVLKGAEKTIRSGIVGMIQFEFNEMNVVSRTYFKDFWDFLPEYNFYRLLPTGEIPLTTYSAVFCEVFGFQNIVCLRKSE